MPQLLYYAEHHIPKVSTCRT